MKFITLLIARNQCGKIAIPLQKSRLKPETRRRFAEIVVRAYIQFENHNWNTAKMESSFLIVFALLLFVISYES